jgi:hypothetical protein
MTPDAYSNLQILNATNADLFSGGGGSNQGFFNAYQMNSWFGFPIAPSPVVASRAAASYTLQFLRGVGDEDDAADMQLNAGPSNTGDANVVWIQARSASNSAHYIQAVVQSATAGGGPYVVGYVVNGTWPTQDDSSIAWAGPGNTLQLGAPNAAQCLAVIDLAALFGQPLAGNLAKSISAGQLSPADAYSIWTEVLLFTEYGAQAAA